MRRHRRRGGRASPGGARRDGVRRLLALEDPDGLCGRRQQCFPASYAGGVLGQPGRPRCTRCEALLAFLEARPGVGVRLAGRSGWLRRTGAGSTPGSGTSTGRSEPCINGRTRSRPGRTSGWTSQRCAERGSWASGSPTAAGTARPENGLQLRSSFDTTINVLDGLLEFERATGGSEQVRTARRGGEEYLLERGLFLAARARGPSSSRRIWSSRFGVLLALRRAGCMRWTTSGDRVRTGCPGWRRR